MAQTSRSAVVVFLGCIALLTAVVEPSRSIELLSLPIGTALDAAGNLYVADTGNHRISKIDFTGTVNTIAEMGESGFEFVHYSTYSSN